MPHQITAEEFRDTLGLFATGVTVVTTALDGTLHGMTANAFASVSLDPLLVLVCVDREAGMHDLLPRSKSFAVTVLAADQEGDSLWFASPRRPRGHDQFDGVAWHAAPVSGCPVLDHGLAWLDCRLTQSYDGGDHTIFLGEVLDLGLLDAAAPLVFFDGLYSTIDHSTAEAINDL